MYCFLVCLCAAVVFLGGLLAEFLDPDGLGGWACFGLVGCCLLIAGGTIRDLSCDLSRGERRHVRVQTTGGEKGVFTDGYDRPPIDHAVTGR